MDNNLLIEKTKEFVKEKCYGEGSGHDWYHIYRVHNTAKFIAEKEGGDLFIIEMTALLHDIDDWKFSEGTETDTTVTEKFLHSLNISQEIIYKIILYFCAFFQLILYVIIVKDLHGFEKRRLFCQEVIRNALYNEGIRRKNRTN